MYQFTMNLDKETLITQLDDLAEVQAILNRVSAPDTTKASVEGVLNLLGSMRDAMGIADAAKLPECPDKLEPTIPPVEPTEMTDTKAVYIAEGFDEAKDEAEFIAAWQHLIDKGIAWKLQGSFGRIAKRMIEEGTCKPPQKKSPIILLNR